MEKNSQIEDEDHKFSPHVKHAGRVVKLALEKARRAKEKIDHALSERETEGQEVQKIRMATEEDQKNRFEIEELEAAQFASIEV